MKIINRIGLLVLFSAAGAILIYLYSSASLDSSSVKWQSLGALPSKAIKVIALGLIQTESGDIYQFVPNPSCTDNCWIKSDNPPPDSQHGLPLNQCGDLPSLENYIDSKSVCDYYGTGLSLRITAIDKNGSIYSWDDKFGGEGDSLIRLVSPYFGAMVGLFVGLIVVLVDVLKSFRKRTKENGFIEKA
jgi:hypothetical protein